MIGRGMPSSQSNAPLPKPIVCLLLHVGIGRTTAADGSGLSFKKSSPGGWNTRHLASFQAPRIWLHTATRNHEK
jgi:hypothetical protein